MDKDISLNRSVVARDGGCLKTNGIGGIVARMALTLSLSQRAKGLKKGLRISSLSLRERVGVRVTKNQQTPTVARFWRLLDF
jgi:hypothetical protein